MTIQYLEKAAQNGPGTWDRRYHERAVSTAISSVVKPTIPATMAVPESRPSSSSRSRNSTENCSIPMLLKLRANLVLRGLEGEEQNAGRSEPPNQGTGFLKTPC